MVQNAPHPELLRTNVEVVPGPAQFELRMPRASLACARIRLLKSHMNTLRGGQHHVQLRGREVVHDPTASM
eukprot:14314295-Alexandrium_andersonii.AAC.1